MPSSIRQQLLVTLLSVVALGWVLTAVTAYYDARHEVEELFDAELAQSARVLLAMSSHELIEERAYRGSNQAVVIPFADSLDGSMGYERKLAFQAWVGDQLAQRSANAPRQPLSDRRSGYSEHVIGGEGWRVFSLSAADSDLRVQVAQSLAIRDELVGGITLRLLIPLLVSLPLLAIVIWVGVDRALRPLSRLARDVASREPDNLAALPPERAPEEILPLVRALNQLFARLQQAFDNERRFTADAAHELRTPLAALKIQAQVAQAATDDEGRRRALGQLLQGVDRATHLVQQLLTLARVDPDTAFRDARPVDLCAIATETLAELAADARARDVELALAPGCAGEVMGNADALSMLLRNLVDNAIRYTPQGGQVEVAIQRDDAGVRLQVADSGPGIPLAERQQVMERFYRGKRAQATGSGLGLSIVLRVAEHHRATVRLGDASLGGLLVEIRFP